MDKLFTLSYACTDGPGHMVGRARGPSDAQDPALGSPNRKKTISWLRTSRYLQYTIAYASDLQKKRRVGV